jgi:hypothetical protein
MDIVHQRQRRGQRQPGFVSSLEIRRRSSSWALGALWKTRSVFHAPVGKWETAGWDEAVVLAGPVSAVFHFSTGAAVSLALS